MSTVKDYIRYLRRNDYPALFDDECQRQLNNVIKQYGELETHETILEIDLSNAARAVDYSIRLNRPTEFGKEFWLELDYELLRAEPVRPCCFFDAIGLKDEAGVERFCGELLTEVATVETIEAVKPMLSRVLRAGGVLYQIGSMAGRDQFDSLRVFIDDARRSDVIECLRQMNWSGDLDRLNEIMAELEPLVEHRNFIVDFDVFDDHISDKLGLNFGSRNKTTAAIDRLLELLKSKGLCVEGKRADVLRFINAFPTFEPYMQNDISHFKLAFEGGRVTKAKAYLRQGDVRYQHDFRAYADPLLMNLELTTKCPLHCPQCYCDLSTGLDMDREVALYWINEAARNRVKVVNLSGGETLIYPHLIDLLDECRRLGLEANVAISGIRADRSTLKALIDHGVADICVSLNGSTEEINRKSRDGYRLAIEALNTLQELGYNRTVINWVMHSFNADDFENMIELAERFDVRAIAVMMFKPDKDHQLPSVPTRAQLLNLNRIIRRYDGKVAIEIEECFSQLRALVGERFFINHNVGITRGCGAGRDGFSVSVDGWLTPCRHLYRQREQYDRLDEYWLKSPILNQLRTVEDRIGAPCVECKYRNNCLPCLSVIWERQRDFKMSDEQCPLGGG
ncbi:MAG: radical SAM protein [Selenomonadaceae bacterium]|nr:radical SAM protein [Selenomonadaceae bacterium]